MIDNGIRFVRVVKSPIVDFRDLSNQLEQGDSFQAVMNAVVKDWHRNSIADEDTIEDEISTTLDVLKAEFSHADIDRIIPMSDNDDPEDIAFDAMCGQPYAEGKPSNRGPAILDHEIKYEVHPTLLSLGDIRRSLKTANQIGYCAGITREQLLAAKEALEQEHSALLFEKKNFTDYPAPASIVLDGAQMKAGCTEDREDVLLNVIFQKTPETYKRLSGLSQPPKLDP